MPSTIRVAVISLIAFTFASVAATAQQRPEWPSERFNRDAPAARNLPGEFDYYALVLSWSPSHCSGFAAQDDDQQCARTDGKRFNFILHGLWPQYEKGYPESCRTRRKPFVPEDLIQSMLDIMPSPRLIIHEYRKHGTCSGLAPEGYYALSRRLFQSVRIPERYRNPMEQQYVSPYDMANEILRANPQLKAENLAIACGSPGNRLKELRICFSRAGEPRACGSNEDQRRLCKSDRIFVPPVRSTARGDAPGISGGGTGDGTGGGTGGGNQNRRRNPLPGPRMDDGARGI
ncbi:MAG: ribonuclease T2 family protein [Hyphomicrobium sp.]